MANPGPNSYNLPSKIVESQGKSMGMKTESKHRAGALGPGPGGYSADKMKQNNVKYSMAGKLRDIATDKKNFQPGPGTYNGKPSQSIPSMKFGSGERPSIDGKKENAVKPGPGAYSYKPETALKDAPKFGFGTGGREKGTSKLEVPGPGQYMSKTFVGRDGPSLSMGAQNTFAPHKKEQAHKPGPGAYSPLRSNMHTSPTYRIGTEKRSNPAAIKSALYQTAPGQYDP